MFFGDKSYPGNVSSFFEGTRQKPNFNQLFSMDVCRFPTISQLKQFGSSASKLTWDWYILPMNSPLKSSESHVSKLIPTWFFPEKSVPGFQEMNRTAGHHHLRFVSVGIYPSVHNGPKNPTYFNGVKWDPCK